MPIPRKLERAINKFAKRDKRISKKLYPYEERRGDLKLYILAKNGRDRKFDLLGIVDAWSAEFEKYRDKTLFSVSTTRKDFGLDQSSNETFFEVIKRATHVAKNGELYAIRDGDTVQAFYLDFAYKVYGQLEANKSFSLADTEPEI